MFTEGQEVATKRDGKFVGYVLSGSDETYTYVETPGGAEMEFTTASLEAYDPSHDAAAQAASKLSDAIDAITTDVVRSFSKHIQAANRLSDSLSDGAYGVVEKLADAEFDKRNNIAAVITHIAEAVRARGGAPDSDPTMVRPQSRIAILAALLDKDVSDVVDALRNRRTALIQNLFDKRIEKAIAAENEQVTAPVMGRR